MSLGGRQRYSNPEFMEGKKKLTNNEKLVRRTFDKAIAKTGVKDDTVSKWLKEVGKLLDEVKKLEKMTDGGKRKIEEDKMLREIKKQSIICEFGPFPQPFLVLDHFFSKDFERFKPTEKALYQLLGALSDDSTHVIGLYGGEGSGKTTLVKAVSKEARNLNLFEKVLLVNASQSQKTDINIIEEIQKKIADLLDMKFNKYSPDERAREIRSKLKNIGPTLVILDDVRTKLDLNGIGIPFDDDRCKVLLTTRHQTECDSMDCQSKIPLGRLSNEEVWTLLKKHSGVDDESPSDLLNVAKEVANECKGPGEIKVVGSSLKDKRIEKWREALERLKNSKAKWDIFLSFTGKDTRYSFTGYLYDALCQAKFKTFMDDEGLECGEEISCALVNAIKASRLSIIVFSENFAYSPWCLDEVVTILESKKTEKHILPIFYKVDPSDVRGQNKSYREAMAKHENRFGKDSEKVKKWRNALSEVANLAGLPYKTGYEYKFIKTIVDKAKSKIA